MQDYHKLQVWQKIHRLTLRVYRATASFPRMELFGLTAQIRRAVTSVEMNIAGGCGRDSNAELGRFLRIALGSASELECQTEIAGSRLPATRGSHWLVGGGSRNQTHAHRADQETED